MGQELTLQTTADTQHCGQRGLGADPLVQAGEESSAGDFRTWQMRWKRDTCIILCLTDQLGSDLWEPEGTLPR